MSNSKMVSELKPCPFCGGEAESWAGGTAEFYGHDHQSISIDCDKCRISMALETCMDKNGETSKGYEFGCSCCNEVSSILRERWNTRTHAEDVRAADEPVAWMYTNSAVKFPVFYDRKQDAAGWTETPLYRRAQLQMVMPERELYTKYLRGMVPSNAKEVSDWRDGWNACIDEFKRLNP